MGSEEQGDEAFSRRQVVAAVIERQGRLLLCRRPLNKRHGGLWEFPGGKMEAGESFLQAGGRELDEELSLQAVSADDPKFSILDEASGFTIHFVKMEANGEPQLKEHIELSWVKPSRLHELELAPSDRAYAEFIKSTGFRT